MHVEPIKDTTFGAVVTGVRLAGIDDAGFAALYAAWLEHALLVLPGQHLSKAEQLEFAGRFGKLEIPITPISNVRADGSLRLENTPDDVVKILKGNMFWHCDSTYMPVQAKGAVFSAEIVPSAGGETGFADMRAAYDALDGATKERVQGLSAYHSLKYSQSKLGHVHTSSSEYSGYGFGVDEPPLRPLVKIHPETGRPSLNVGRHAFGIDGMTPEESESLIEGLVAFAAQAPRTYHHAWSAGDVIIWDNRCLMHRAMPWDFNEPRVMWHSRLAGDGVHEFAAHA